MPLQVCKALNGESAEAGRHEPFLDLLLLLLEHRLRTLRRAWDGSGLLFFHESKIVSRRYRNCRTGLLPAVRAGLLARFLL
jgi:hypothetical protein